jgi:hypothetical protein
MNLTSSRTERTSQPMLYPVIAVSEWRYVSPRPTQASS